MKIEEFEQRFGFGVDRDGRWDRYHETLDRQRCMDELNATRARPFSIHRPTSKPALISSRPTRLSEPQQTERVRLEDRVAEFNHRGVKVAREAREAAKHEFLIAGSIGPRGHSQLREASVSYSGNFSRAAEALENAVWIFILETFSDLEELSAAVAAIRSFRNSRLLHS